MVACLAVCLLHPAAVFEAAAAGGSGDAPSAEFRVHGFIELESFIHTDTDRSFPDAVQKNEIRQRLELRYGLEHLYLFMASDLYLQPDFLNDDDPLAYRYARDHEVARNLRISASRYDWSFNELFLNYTRYPFRLRIGNQIHNWGTADVFNPTSYFTPYDFREFLFRDDDELKQGVPSFSGMYFADAFTTELVVSFVHVPTLLPPSGNFWSLEISENLFDTLILESEALDANIENVGIGARISTTLFQTDLSFSVYHGPDRDPVIVPQSVLFPPNQPLLLLVEPRYFVINTIGMDLSRAAGDFVFQFEAAYSPDKRNYVVQKTDPPAAIRLPFETRKSHFVSYAAGFNYFVPVSRIFESHTGETVFTLDWFQSHYFDDELGRPFLSDILTLRLQDSFLDGRLNASLTAMFETRHGGTLFWPAIQYDFQNGFTIELAYADINGDRGDTQIEPLFYHFRDNEIVMLKVRYEF